MRDDQAVTTLQDGLGGASIDVLLSQNLSRHPDHHAQPMMVAQVYPGDESGEQLVSVWFHEDQARALRNHLNRFLAHCERQRKEKS